jgi:hypothetical protein
MSSAAPGSAAGYTFQFERALYHLASSPAGAKVGIETDDDVTVRLPGGQRFEEQDKHSIVPTGQPFTDRSYNLWNALSGWAAACKAGDPPAEVANFFLVTNRPVPDCLARRIHEANSKSDAHSCLAEIEAAGAAPRDAVSDLVAAFLSQDHSLLLELITRTQVLDGVSVCGDALRTEILNRLPLPSAIDGASVLDELGGWLVRVTMELWRARQPAWISRQAFVDHFHALLNTRRRDKQRERNASLLTLPTPDEIQKHNARTFVQQIELVAHEQDDIDGAIRDFLQAASERLRLSKEGDIPDAEWAAFKDRLKSNADRLARK